MKKNNIENATKKVNSLNIQLFIYFLFSIFPTIVFGILKISTYTNIIVWIWDAITIIFFFFIFSSKKNIFRKRDLIYIVFFLIFIVIQFLDYLQILPSGNISFIYVAVPILYLIHFITDFSMLGNRKVDNINFDKFYNYFLIFLIMACAYNIFINFGNIGNLSKFSNRYIGFSSFFNHRNGFGQILYIGIIFNYYLLKKKHSKKNIIYFIILITNLILTFSRAAILATAVFFITYWLQEQKSNSVKKEFLRRTVFIIASSIIIIYIFNNEEIMKFLNYYVFRSEEGLSGRTEIWTLSLSLLGLRKIFTGYGIGTSLYFLSSRGLTNTHNSIIELLLTGGIIFLLIYILIFIDLFKDTKYISDTLYKKIIRSFYISFITYSMFEKILLFGTGYAPVMFTISLVVIPKIIVNQRGEVDE